MPSLKDLNCAIELSESQQAFREFGTIYGDGFVETFIPVPSKPQSFSIHLTSNKFIAPGVAIFVYVDGVYQCNRNRQDLKLRKLSDSRSLVDFRVRQKEERQKDGSMIAREWAFDKFNIASADDAPNLCSPNIFDNIGCIEVVVLRCAGTRNAKSASTMNFDGAGDFPDRRFDLTNNSSPSNERSMYDDRGPFFNNFGNGHGPPPPILSYHSPYAETLRSQEGSASRSRRTTYTPQGLFPPASVARHSRTRSRYSEPVSPGARRASDLPPSGFQYGSGPIPRDGEIHNIHPPNVVAVQPPAVDPIWLNNLLTTAIKQGVEESRRMDVQSEGQAGHKGDTLDAKTTNQPPGAWPDSPFDAPTLPYHQSEPAAFSSRDRQSDHGSQWNLSQTGWGKGPPRSRAGTHVTWDAKPVSETESSSVGGWNLREETPSDSWDTGDTWLTDRVAEWEASSQEGTYWVPDAPSHYNARPSSPVTSRTHDRRRSKHDSQRKSRTKSRSRHSRRKHDVGPSTEENGSWSYLDRPSDSVVSLSSSDDTLQPSHSRSRIETSRRRSKSRSRPSKSLQCGIERRQSRHSHHTPTWGLPADAVSAPVPSVITRMTPTVMNAPVSAIPIQVQPRQPSAYAGPPDSVLPPPGWGATVHDIMRKPSNVTSNMLPAPYAPSLKDFVQSTIGDKKGGRRSHSSSSWSNDKKDGAVKLSWGKETEMNTGWAKNTDSGWCEKEPKENDRNGWYTIDEDKTGGWTKADNDKKVEAADGWSSKDSGWGTKPSPPNEKKGDKMNDWAGLKSALKSAFENPPTPEVPWETQSWTVPPDNTIKHTIHQATTPPIVSAPAPSQSNQLHQSSPRMSNKSLSKYRQPSALPLTPHWQFPPPPSTPTNTLHLRFSSSNNTYIAPAEPRLTITQRTSSTKGIEHAVRPGKAMQYGHVVGRPEYLDGLDKPYAVFRFKYRSKNLLKDMFGEGVEIAGMAEGDKDKDKDKEKVEKLKNVPQEVLINKMMELERKLKSKVKDVEGAAGSKKQGKKSVEKEKQKEKDKQRRMSEKTDGVARDLTEQWVERHSRDPSVRAKSLGVGVVGREKAKNKEQKEKEREVGEIWGQDVDDGWGGGDVKW